MQITYGRFSSVPEAGQLAAYPAAALWYQLDGELRISHAGHTFWQDEFSLFQLAALLQHWLKYRPAPLPESRLVVEDYAKPAALLIRRQPGGISLIWEEAGQEVSSLAVLETEFNRASYAFLEQLQADAQSHFGVDIRPLYRGIPF